MQRLILANIIVFAVQLLLKPVEALLFVQWNSGVQGGWVNFLFGFQPPLFLHGMLWKPFTYQFLHGGLMHLFMNMLWLFFFGSDVERVLGTRQFFRFYIFCGALGVLATILPYLVTGSTAPVIGASGAVMGVLVAFAMVEPDRQLFLFPLPMPINARALILIVVVLNIIYSFGESSVSWITHFGGMGAGFVYMWLRPKISLWQREKRFKTHQRNKKSHAGKKGGDRVGEAVDNIFKFKDRDHR